MLSSTGRLLCLAALCALVLSPARVSAQTYTANIDAESQVPPMTEDEVDGATATFTMTMSGADTMSWQMQVSDIVNLTMAHIHIGGPTENGNPVVILLPVGGTMGPSGPPAFPEPKSGSMEFSGTFTPANFITNMTGASMMDFMNAIAQDQLYVNLHTVEYPNGAIRGQIEEPVAPTPAPAPAPSSAPTAAALCKGAFALLAAVLAAALV